MPPMTVPTVILPPFIAMFFMLIMTMLFVVPASMFAAVPMPISLPTAPIPSHIIMCNPVVSRVRTAVSWRNVDYCVRNTPDFYRPPWAVIPIRDEPAMMIRAIPIPMIKEDISRHFRRIIDGTSGHHRHKRRRGYVKTRQRNIDAHVDLGIAVGRSHHEYRSSNTDSEQNQFSFFHGSTSKKRYPAVSRFASLKNSASKYLLQSVEEIPVIICDYGYIYLFASNRAHAVHIPFTPGCCIQSKKIVIAKPIGIRLIRLL